MNPNQGQTWPGMVLPNAPAVSQNWTAAAPKPVVTTYINGATTAQQLNSFFNISTPPYGNSTLVAPQ